MPKQAVVGIVTYNNQVLIGQKKHKPGHAMSQEWHIPGGKVHENETPSQALTREIYEEAQIEITNIAKIDEIYVKEDDFLVHWFVCKATNSDVIAGDDLTKAKFVKKKDVITLCGTNAIARWPKQIKTYLQTPPNT